MARYIATSGSNFTPFSYDEMVKPLQEATELHNAAADTYDALALDTQALNDYIGPDDTKARERYDNYMGLLGDLQDDLWQNGFNANTRRALQKAKGAYAKDIVGIKNALDARQKRSAEYWKAAHDDPSMIMGADPGSASLDLYLDNPNYGQNWFAYSGNDFEKEVADEVKSRASELLRGLDEGSNVSSNPALRGYLTRIVEKGLTNQEVALAGQLANQMLHLSPEQREAVYNSTDSIPYSVGMVAEAILSRMDATGIRSSDASDDMYDRMLSRGIAGAARGIFEPDYKDFEDQDYAYRKALSLEREKYRINHPEGLYDEWERIQDTDTYAVAGLNRQKALKQLDSDLGVDFSPIKASTGQFVQDSAAASELVYSGQIRRNAYQKLGFDIGRDPSPGIDGLTPSSKYLQGTVMINGKSYDTMYDPRLTNSAGGKGGVLIRETGSGIDWASAPEDPNLTLVYKRARVQYDSNREYYRKRDPELFRQAVVTPDRQAKMYDREKIGFNTPLGDYRGIVLSKPENRENNLMTDTYVARTGTDSGKYLQKFSAYLYDGLSRIDPKAVSQYKGTSEYVHEILPDGSLGKDVVKNPTDIFFDKDGNSTVSNISLNEDALLNGYLVYSVPGRKSKYAVNANVLSSDIVRSILMNGRSELLGALQATDGAERNALARAAVARASSQLKSALGYYVNTVSEGGTSSTNKN